MKARVPSIKRSCQLSLASGLSRAHLTNCNLIFVGRFSIQGSSLCQGCQFSSSTPSDRISLAERIKQFLPTDAIENSASYEENVLIEVPENPKTSLAAFETEISRAVTLVEALKFREATGYLLEALPFQAILTALTDRIVPAIQKGPLGLVGVTELAYILFCQGNGALASQMLNGAESRTYEIGQKGKRSLDLFAPVQLIEDMPGQARSAVQIDALIQNMKGSPQLQGLCFPQLLSNTEVPPWLKVHLMVQLDLHEFRRWLYRYTSSFSPHAISLLASLSSPLQFEIIADWVVQGDRLEVVPLVLQVTSEPSQYHQICRQLLRRSVNTPLPDNLATSLLHHALRFKQSYDIANICKKCSHAFKYPEHITLMAKALLAAAFAQRKAADPDGCKSRAVLQSSKELHSFLVNRVLTPVAHDNVARNAVIGLAAMRLLRTHPREIPGKVLWKLLLSLPGPLGGPANTALAKLVVKRPYIEQARYMALPTVTAHGVRELLKWHIIKIMEHRRMNGVKPNLPQAKEDIHLLVAGLILASEKGSGGPCGSRETNAESGPRNRFGGVFSENKLDTSSVTSVFNELFERGSTEETHTVAQTAIESVSQQHYDRELSASIAFSVIAELVKQKSYTVARQLLKTVGPERFPPTTAQTLLLNLARDQPEDSYRFVLWLTKLNASLASSKTINKMMAIITTSPELSESQLTNRFQSLRHLLRTELNSPVEPDPAISLVEALISSAFARQGGSLRRLQWALGVAKQAGVPATKFADWSAKLDEMRDSKQGYWSSSE